ncbi:MAG: DUF2973 domain-containing protein, partial [Synechococcaceae cyanobacterium]|nr:DUF2973 domain-containing protein [Synechococcaceae cyanobacterium]
DKALDRQPACDDAERVQQSQPVLDSRGDRTGRLTIHPELLDADGQLTRDDLLTVRFSGDQDRPALPSEGN